MLSFVSPLLLLLTLLLNQASTSHPRLEITSAGSVKTFGAAGFEHFVLDGRLYLVSANFWDGQDRQMAATSEIFFVIEAENSQLDFVRVQGMRTKGAHGADFFSHDDNSYLVIPSYYGCEGSKRSCPSTHLFEYQNSTRRFSEVSTISAYGAAQTDHFEVDGRMYMIVTENFSSRLNIYHVSKKGVSTEVKYVAGADVRGVAACAVSIIEGRYFITAASYHNRGWKTTSTVFEFHPKVESLSVYQTIATTGPHDVEPYTYKNNHFLFFSEDRDDETVEIYSSVYIWSSDNKKFELIQAIPSDGAHASEIFEMGGRCFLFIANFGDRHGKRYNASSSFWMYAAEEDFSLSCESGEESCDATVHDTDKGHFKFVGSIPTFGATDGEFFEFSGKYYLAISEEGDLSKGDKSSAFNSRIYMLQLKDDDGRKRF